MATTYRQLSVRFSTADAAPPQMEYDGGRLIVRYIDWREDAVLVEFSEVVAFRWQDEANLPSEIRDDSSYEILDSPWIAELRVLGAADESHRHYKLCFNAHGVLDVVSGPLRSEVSNSNDV